MKKKPNQGELKKLFLTYRCDLDNIARSFHRSTGIDLTELQGQSYQLFVEAYLEYDPSKGASFKTWTITKVRSKLITFAYDYTHAFKIKGEKNRPYEDTYDESFHAVGVPNPIDFMEKFFTHPDDVVRAVINTILNEDTEDLRLYQGIDKKVYETTGFSYKQVWKAFKEIKFMLQEA